jgi:hypothetical protein
VASSRSGAIYVPSLAVSEYVVAVCAAHDFMREGDYFSFETMAKSPGGFLAAFDAQLTSMDDQLRAWLVEADRKVAPPSFLTVAQAAMRENVSERTVQRWCETGALGKGAWRTSDGQRASWRIDPAALDARRSPRRPRIGPKVEAADVRAPRRGKVVAW